MFRCFSAGALITGVKTGFSGSWDHLTQECFQYDCKIKQLVPLLNAGYYSTIKEAYCQTSVLYEYYLKVISTINQSSVKAGSIELLQFSIWGKFYCLKLSFTAATGDEAFIFIMFYLLFLQPTWQNDKTGNWNISLESRKALSQLWLPAAGWHMNKTVTVEIKKHKICVLTLHTEQ